MKRVVTRLASMAGGVVLTVALPTMADVAYGASQPHRASGPASGLTQLDGLARTMLFPARIAAGGQGALDGVDVRAREDGWAVGDRCSGRCRTVYTLIEHWNGRRWLRVPSPNVSRTQVLTSVSAVSARDAWAVGAYFTRNDEVIRTLIEHWNGRRWSRVPSPNPSASPSNGFNLLASVTAVSGRDVWAAGDIAQGTIVRPLITHWNGIRWSTVPSPRRTSISQIGSISAASAQDIWAVGSYFGTELASRALIERWNGTGWRIVAAPVRPRGQQQLAAVTAISARSAWAVGSVCPDHCERDNPPSRTVILHWNGRRWVPAASPSPGAASALTGLSASSATNAWAVGQYCTKACPSPQAENRGQILFLHWNGARWSRVAGPSPGRDVHGLLGVSTLSRRSAFAVGETCIRACNDHPVTQPLTLHWNGQRWRVG
jgi:hypothetical protein